MIPRDRHAAFFAALGVVASSIENIATEIRHMQRTEVLEAEEFFSKGQKGSSAMPHKRNPVLTENLTGLGSAGAHGGGAGDGERHALWHERDISHSSVERNIGPDTTITLDFALARLTGVIEKLVIYPDNMLSNLNKFHGLVHSQRVLLALTQAGVSREDAYRLVQRNAMKVWEEGADFMAELKADAEVTSSAERDVRSKKNSISPITPSMWTRFLNGSLGKARKLVALRPQSPARLCHLPPVSRRRVDQLRHIPRTDDHIGPGGPSDIAWRPVRAKCILETIRAPWSRASRVCFHKPSARRARLHCWRTRDRPEARHRATAPCRFLIVHKRWPPG